LRGQLPPLPFSPAPGITIALDEDGSARVLSVAAGSPVAAADAVHPGDIVTKVNGQFLRCARPLSPPPF
jgi:C-terminal processing protease CtpA/Prc